jgi:hypothetical protein
VNDPATGKKCNLLSGKRHRNRHYWEYLEKAGIVLQTFGGNQGCPFQGPLYQLLRQFILAAFMRTTGEFEYVEVAAMSLEGNRNLNHLSRQLRPLMQSKDDGIIDVWNKVLSGVPSLRHIVVEELMARVDAAEPGIYLYIRLQTKE